MTQVSTANEEQSNTCVCVYLSGHLIQEISDSVFLMETHRYDVTLQLNMFLDVKAQMKMLRCSRRHSCPRSRRPASPDGVKLSRSDPPGRNGTS